MEKFSRIWLAVMLACMVFTLAKSITEREQVVHYEMCMDGEVLKMEAHEK